VEPSLLNRVRVERTARELDLLEPAIAAWAEQREALDRDAQGRYVGRHKTQLETVRSLTAGVIQEIRAELAQVDLTAGAGELYRACRDVDLSVVWLHRLWAFIKEKFDQRDDRAPGARVPLVLRAADEVIWSCYHPIFVRAKFLGAGVEHGPPPLPFVEPQYSPVAIPGGQPLPSYLEVPPGLDFLGDEFRTLPLPVVRLPPWCVDAPWWLIYIAHEVGHHVQHDLKLVGHMREQMTAAAQEQGLEKRHVERWGRWGQEIFADLFSVMMAGPWALWALAEAVWASDEEMARVLSRAYPPSVVRLALMAETAARLGIADPAALRGLDLKRIAAARPRAEMHMTVVEGAVERALGELPHKLRTLPQLCNVDKRTYAPTGAIARGARVLRGQGNYSQSDLQQLDAARTLVSGSLSAWSALAAQQDGAARRDGVEALAERTRELLSQTGPAGTRSAFMPAGAPPAEGAALGKSLLAAMRARAQAAPELEED
jgi:hypothetical protein